MVVSSVFFEDAGYTAPNVAVDVADYQRDDVAAEGVLRSRAVK